MLHILQYDYDSLSVSQGLIDLTLSVYLGLVSASAKPFFLPAAPAIPAAGAIALGAGGLVVTNAAGATVLSVPAATLVAGKVALATKLLLLKLYLDARNRNQNQRGNRRG